MIQFGAVYDLSLNEWIKPDNRIIVPYTKTVKRQRITNHYLLTGKEKDIYITKKGTGGLEYGLNLAQRYLGELFSQGLLITAKDKILTEDFRESSPTYHGLTIPNNHLIDSLA